MITFCKTLGLNMCFFAPSYPLHLALRILCIKALPVVYPCVHRALRDGQAHGHRRSRPRRSCVHRALRDGQVRGGTAQIIRCLTSPFAFYLCLSALICGCFSAVSYASPPPSADVHVCLPLDSKDIRARDSIYAATKHTLKLNVGEPRTVRMIYFLPNDRPFRQEVVDSMKVTIRQIQTFFAEQMQAHGHGKKTFRFETDAQDDPLVHRVDGQYPDSHYLDDTDGTVPNEIAQEFDLDANIYFLVVDNGKSTIGNGGRRVGGTGRRGGRHGGAVLVADGFPWTTAIHELGHAFGLRHDFRDTMYIMSYGGNQRNSLSACAAEFLAVHPYFNPDVQDENTAAPTIELISPRRYPAGSTSVSVQLKISDLDGLHQVILYVGPVQKVKACRGLEGEQDAVVEFDYDGIIPPDNGTSLSNPLVHIIHVEVVDTEGNVGYNAFKLRNMLTERNLIATLEGHTNGVYSVAFSPDGTTLASGSWDNTVKLWDIATGTNIATLKGHTSRVESVAFSPDGTMLASGAHDTMVKIWDMATRTNIATLEGHKGEIYSVAFSPDGTTLAAGGTWGSLLWDVAAQADTTTFTGHTGYVSSVAFSSDGIMLASASIDATVKLWDIATRRNIATLEGHMRTIWSVTFSPDGTILASGTNNDVIKLWDMSEYVTPVVNIPDANLRAVIRDALGKSRFAPITTTDMANLTTLDASNGNIRELDGLEFATNLTTLNLVDNPLSAPAINTHIPILQDRGIEVLFDKIPSSDFDGDGTIGLDDFFLFVAQFGFSEDDEGYEARFDLDGDGVIGIGDFLIFANAFGKVASSN